MNQLLSQSTILLSIGDFMHILADRIRQARELAGITRAALARHVGVRPSAASQWEQIEGTAPSVAHLIRIAQITDIAFEWLATGRGPPHPLTLHETPAIDPGDFAHMLFEERVLRNARSIPLKLREPLLHFLDAGVGNYA